MKIKSDPYTWCIKWIVKFHHTLKQNICKENESRKKTSHLALTSGKSSNNRHLTLFCIHVIKKKKPLQYVSDHLRCVFVFYLNQSFKLSTKTLQVTSTLAKLQTIKLSILMPIHWLKEYCTLLVIISRILNSKV